MTKHIVLPDTHTHPRFHNKRATWIGNLIADERPDEVIHIGDGPDMPSLCGYDKGTKGFQGRTYAADVESWLDFQERMFKPIKARKKKLPTFTYLEGNHYHRIKRAVEFQSELEGTIGLKDLELNRYWNRVVEYEGRTPGIISIDGICYAHYFVSGVMGKSIGGERPAHSLLAKQGQSCTQGHVHTLDYAIRTRADGKKNMGLVCGCYQDYYADWAGVCNNLWWPGVIIKRNVEGGSYDPQFISLEALKKEYG